MDLGCLDDAHHNRNDKVYMQAGERDGSASEPLNPGSKQTFTTAYDTRHESRDIIAAQSGEKEMAGR